jgi:hypothetical protein
MDIVKCEEQRMHTNGRKDVASVQTGVCLVGRMVRMGISAKV